MSELLEDSPVIRIARMRARPGVSDGLMGAAKGNVDDAMAAPGCLSAEVCADPDEKDGILVIPRWESMASLQAFLAWHETIAHASLADFSDEKPVAVHHQVLVSGSAAS